MFRNYFWQLRNGHWSAATKLIAIIAIAAPIVIFFLKQKFLISDSIADLLIPIASITVLILVLFFNLFASRKKVKLKEINYASEVSELEKKLKSHEKFNNFLKGVNTVYIGKIELVPVPINDTQDIDFKELSLLTKLNEHQFKKTYNDLRPNIRVNTAHALVPEANFAQSFDNSITEIEYIKGDYASLQTLINNISDDEYVPRTLGAGGLLITLDQELLFLNKGTLENPLLHVFGGNFEPNLKIPGMSYDRSLSLNAEREIMEESGCTLNVDNSLFIVHREGDCPNNTDWSAKQTYLPVHHIGVIVPNEQVKMLRGSSEGRVHRIKISELGESMLNLDNWIPAGWLTVMTWLHLDGPCQNSKPIFKKNDVRKQLKIILESK